MINASPRSSVELPSGTRLAVLGSPISHSLSPAIHQAAYRAIGANWDYDAVEVRSGELEQFMATLDDDWRGLSLTMPLKREVLPLLRRTHPLVDVVGAANTVLLTKDGLVGFNTDVYGIVAALRSAGVTRVSRVHIIGSGATASSVLSAVTTLGATRVSLEARTPANGESIVRLGVQLGVDVEVSQLGVESRIAEPVDLVVSTLPGDVLTVPIVDREVRDRAVLFDVAYAPWPTGLAREWLGVGGSVVSGLEMLLHQAVGQIRVFVAGSPEKPLDGEEAMFAAMRAAVA